MRCGAAPKKNPRLKEKWRAFWPSLAKETGAGSSRCAAPETQNGHPAECLEEYSSAGAYYRARLLGSARSARSGLA